jgi:hypothetical protein
VAFLCGKLLLRILKTSFSLILAILAIALVLQYGFDISPSQLWGKIGNLSQDIIQFVKTLDLNGFMSLFSS